MGYALPYNESFEISIEDGMVVAPRRNGGNERIRMRSSHGRVRHEYLVGSQVSLQQQMVSRAILILERKRAVLDSEAAIKLREVIDGTVDHIFGSQVLAYDSVTIAWISYAFNRIEFLVIEMVRETRNITVRTIEDILRRFCPLPPIC